MVQTTGMLPSPPFLSIISPLSDAGKRDMNVGRRAPPPHLNGESPPTPHCGDKLGRHGKGTSLHLFCFLTHSAHASDNDDGVPQPL